MNLFLFISCPKGLEYLLEIEAKSIGLKVTQVSPQGVYGEGSLTTAYNLCIWSRIANRVQVILFNGSAHNVETIQNLCRQFHWSTVFSPDKTFAIEFHGQSDQIRNTMFGAQIVKDSIADHFRKLTGHRPTVARSAPQILIHSYLKNNQLTVSFDLTGYSLHQRGYRAHAGSAPIKENVAAALLLRSDWQNLSTKEYGLHDPFCGSGTIVIEAAMIAAHIAPGLLRNDQSLLHWSQHQPMLWDKLRKDALALVKPCPIKIIGTDKDKKSIEMAIENAKKAGVAQLVEFKIATLGSEINNLPTKGLFITNPPYGERLQEATELMPIYKKIGELLHTKYQGWQASVLTSNPILAKAIGLRSHKQYTIFNGAIECKLYCFEIDTQNKLKNTKQNLSANAEMFANRLQKNFAHLKKWSKRNHISCFRVYDADLPEYAFAIDLYDNYAVLQEYSPPASIPTHKAEQRSLDVIQVSPRILEIPEENLIVKTRKKQKGNEQYKKLNETKHSLTIKEGDIYLKVNLYDYLDTGLFLDHRLLRLKFSNLQPNTRFLNCFCYTASASVHAAMAGALTTNVDLSPTYMNWAKDNYQLNKIPLNNHQFIQEDCISWLQRTHHKFDVILLDPPSFSNSKRTTNTLDIQRDHEKLIHDAIRILAPEGTLYFSTNRRGFKISEGLFEKYQIKDISLQTIDEDFKQNPKIHKCFEIKHNFTE